MQYLNLMHIMFLYIYFFQGFWHYRSQSAFIHISLTWYIHVFVVNLMEPPDGKTTNLFSLVFPWECLLSPLHFVVSVKIRCLLVWSPVDIYIYNVSLSERLTGALRSKPQPATEADIQIFFLSGDLLTLLLHGPHVESGEWNLSSSQESRLDEI